VTAVTTPKTDPMASIPLSLLTQIKACLQQDAEDGSHTRELLLEDIELSTSSTPVSAPPPPTFLPTSSALIRHSSSTILEDPYGIFSPPENFVRALVKEIDEDFCKTIYLYQGHNPAISDTARQELMSRTVVEFLRRYKNTLNSMGGIEDLHSPLFEADRPYPPSDCMTKGL
jgi:hypothetical protein